MLEYGLKVAWFAISLSGLLSNWASFVSFRRISNSWWLAVTYSSANTILQVIFCLGLIWRLTPSLMPKAFCTAQIILMQTSWAMLTSICAACTICMATQRFRNISWFIRWLRSTPFHLTILLGYPVAIFVLQLATVLRFDAAAQPIDEIFCDASHPMWIRLLGYAGCSLIISIPSLLLSSYNLFRSFRPEPNPVGNPLEIYPPAYGSDAFTPPPTRRTFQRETRNSSPITLPSLRHPDEIPTSDGGHLSSSHDHSSTPLVPDVDQDADLTPPGRARVMVKRTRYHLPSDWVTARASPDSARSAMAPSPASERERSEARYTPSPLSHPSNRSSSYSPIIFATPPPTIKKASLGSKHFTEEEKIDGSVRVSIESNSGKAGFHWDGRFIAEDKISASLKWARNSDDLSSLGDKSSSLEFSRENEEHGIEDLASYGTKSPQQLSALSPRFVRQKTLFLLCSSLVQIIASITSLIDIISRRTNPTPFGTQHVALILVAWAPTIFFGIELPFKALSHTRSFYLHLFRLIPTWVPIRTDLFNARDPVIMSSENHHQIYPIKV
ncbi:hypothetical protein ABKN59_002184 [Abortiporus biennis]